MSVTWGRIFVVLPIKLNATISQVLGDRTQHPPFLHTTPFFKIVIMFFFSSFPWLRLYTIHTKNNKMRLFPIKDTLRTRSLQWLSIWIATTSTSSVELTWFNRFVSPFRIASSVCPLSENKIMIDKVSIHYQLKLPLPLLSPQGKKNVS